MMKARSWRAPKWEAIAWRVTRHCVILFAVSGAIALFSQESGQRVSASGPKSPPPASAYAGDAACASCHEKEAKAYFKTPHYLDSSAASAKTILGDFTPGKNVLRTPNPDLIFAMIAANDGFFQSAVNIRDPQNLTGEAQKFDIVVGSGRHGQTYLYWKGDQLFELPVSYWTWTHTWINSPGYPDRSAVP
jgi:cytochrome c553